MLKRTLSLFLAFVMVFSILPVNALAEELIPDEDESLLLEPVEVTEDEPETEPPSETEETEPKLVPETVPETVTESAPETAQGNEPELLLVEAPESVIDPNGAADGTGGTSPVIQVGDSIDVAIPAQGSVSYQFTAPQNANYCMRCTDEYGDHPYARVTLNDQSIANDWLDIWFDAVAGNVYEITLENSQDEEISCTIQLAKTPSLESITPGYSANISAFVGQTKQLYVSLSPVEADPGALVWESDNETVAKPVQYGLKTVRYIELLKAGTAHITVSAPGCDSPAVFTIEVSDTDGTMTLDVSQEVTLEAYKKIAYTFIAPGNGEYVLWSPMDDLTLEADGDAYDAGGDGSCAFEASEGDRFILSCWAREDTTTTINVSEAVPATGISLSPATISRCVGQECWINVLYSPRYSSRENLTWSSSNQEVVRISEGGWGRIELVGVGTATVTATTENGLTATCEVTVTADDSESIAVGDAKPVSLTQGGSVTYQFTAPSDGTYIFWTDPALYPVIEVFDEGTPVGRGWRRYTFNASADKTYTVTASCNPEDSMDFTLHLDQVTPVDSIFLSENRVAISVGQTRGIALEAPVETADRSNVRWWVEDDGILEIPEAPDNGNRQNDCLFTGLKAGTTTLHVSLTDDYGTHEASCTVTVTQIDGDWTLNEAKSLTMTPSDNNVPCYSFRFTAPEDTGYIVWQENGDWGWINVFTSTGEWIGLNGGGFRQFDAKKGETYYIQLGSYYYEPITDVFHLDNLTPAQGISPRYPEQAKMSAYSGERIWLPLGFTPGNASRGQISWTSDNNNSVEVVHEGIDSCEVLLKQPGTATITATHNRVAGVSTSFTITVKPSGTWELDETKSLTMTPNDNNDPCYAFRFTAPSAGEYVIHWNEQEIRGFDPHVNIYDMSSGGQISGGNASAYFYAEEAGKDYLITIQPCSDRSYDVNFTLSRATDQGGISFWDSALEGYVGERIWNRVSSEPANYSHGKITWTSSNQDVVRISNPQWSACEYELVAPGTATLTATDEHKNSASFTITVKPAEVWRLNETKDVAFESQGCVSYHFTAEPGSYAVWNESEGWPMVEVFDPNGGKIAMWWGRTCPFVAEQEGTYLIKLYADRDEPYDAQFHLETAAEVESISISLPDPMECCVNDIFEGDLDILPRNHEAVRVDWYVDDGLALLDSGGTYFKVKMLTEGEHTLTATVLDEKGNPTNISDSITFQVSPVYPFENGKRTLRAGWIQPYSFTAPEDGEYTLWHDSDEWIGFHIVDLVENETIAEADNVLHCHLQRGRAYSVNIWNASDNEITLNVWLEKDVDATGIRIDGDTNFRFVGESVWLHATSEPANSQLGESQWFITKGDVEPVFMDGYRCVLKLKGAGDVTVTVKNGSFEDTITFPARALSNVGDKVTIPAEDAVAFTVTPETGGSFTAWAERDDEWRWLWVSVWDASGEFITSGDNAVTFEAEEGKTYLVRVTNNNDQPVSAKLCAGTSAEDYSFDFTNIESDTYYVGECIEPNLVYSAPNAPRTDGEWTVDKEGITIFYSYPGGARLRFDEPGIYTLTATDANGVSASHTFQVESADSINPGDIREIDIKPNGHRAFRFTPETSGTYLIRDESERWCSFQLFDPEGRDFWCDKFLRFDAEAGQTYTISIYSCDGEDARFDLSLNEAESTVKSLTLSEEQVTVFVGDWLGIDAIFQPAAASTDDIRWEIVQGSLVASIGNTYGPRAEVNPLKAGTAILQATCGGKTARCTITVKGRKDIAPGGSSTVTLSPDEFVGYTFTPEKSGNYYFYEADRQGLEIIVWDEQYNWVDGTSDGRVRILNAEAGKTYNITVTNYRSVPVTAELHLEKAVAATRITLSRTENHTKYVFAGNAYWVIAYTDPVNGYQGQLKWSIPDDYKPYVDFIEEEYDPRGDGLLLGFHDDAPAGALVLTCEDTETGLSATLDIVVKSSNSIAVGKEYQVVQHDEEECDQAIFVPTQDGTYVLKSKSATGAAEVWVYTGDDEIIGTIEGTQTELTLELKEGVTYYVGSILLDAKQNGIPGSYTLWIVPEIPAGVNPLSFESNHISIRKDETADLTLTVSPETLSNLVTLDYDASVITVSDGKVAVAENAGSGTAYITATLKLADITYTARCRVDIIADDEIAGAQFSTTAPIVELFSSNYTTFSAIPYKNVVGANGKTTTESVNACITDVAFEMHRSLKDADFEVLNSLFDLEIADSRTVQIVPDQTEIKKIFDKENGALSVKGSYTVNLVVTFNETASVTIPIKLTIKKSVPTLKTGKLAFNSFITGDTQPIVLTGGTVTGIRENIAMQTNKTSVLDKWLTLSEDGTLSLDYKAGYEDTKKYSGNVYLDVDVEGWNVPAKVTVPVSVAYTTPSLKLSASSVTLGSGEAYEHSSGIPMTLLCGKRGETLPLLKVSDLYTETEGFSVEDFNAETGSFTLLPTTALTKATPVTLQVAFTNTGKVFPLTVRATPKAVTLTAKPASFKLNSLRGDCAVIALTASPSDYTIESIDDIALSLVDKKNQPAEDLFNISLENGILRVETTPETEEGTSYKLTVNAIGGSKKTITLTTLTEKQSVITASAKISGAVDLTFPEKYAVVLPAFTNYTSRYSELFTYEITDSKGNPIGGLELVSEDGQYRLLATDSTLNPGSYNLRASFQLDNGEIVEMAKPIRFTVKRTAVTLKLSKTSVVLNTEIGGDWATVDVTCLTKDYDFVAPEEPVVTPPKNFGADTLDVNYCNGMLIIRTTESTPAGKTYTVSLKARDVKEDRTVSVRVTTAAAGKKVGATLKAKGTIDVVRDTSFVEITPFYSNYSGEGNLIPELTIQKYGIKDRSYSSPISHDDFIVVSNDNGTFTVTRKPGADVDLTQFKYRAELTFRDISGEPVENSTPAYAALSVKSNAVKAAVTGTPVLYKVDGYSRGTFRLNIADGSVNPIVDVTSASGLYEIYDYGNGEYAIGFKNNTVDAKAKYPTSVTLNIRLDGNATASVKVTLKLTLK